jgi:endonuclease VIII
MWAATRIRPALLGRVPDELSTPHPRLAGERWPERLSGRAVTEIRTHGKNLFLGFEGGYVLHSHLRMTGAWDVRQAGGAGSARRAARG